MRDSRRMPVPVGLDGLRVDSGLSKLLGLSRTVVADLASSGDILIDGVPASKSDRLTTDSWLDVTLPESRSIADEPAREVEGMDILYSDSDVIVVDKPVGVAAHPTMGWDGPTVTSGLRAAGFRVSTSGPPERQGIVQRLDVGTSGVMIRCSSRRFGIAPSIRRTTPWSKDIRIRRWARLMRLSLGILVQGGSSLSVQMANER